MFRIPFVFAILIGCVASAAAQPNSAPRDHEGNPLPPGAKARLGSSAFRSDKGIQSFAFSADNAALLVWDGSVVRAWDARTGTRLEKSPARTQPSFVFDGTRRPSHDRRPDIFVKSDGTDDGKTVTVVDKDGKELLRFPVKDLRRTVDYDPLVASTNWSQVAAVFGKAVKVYDVATGREVAQFKRDRTGGFCVRFAPDGKSLFIHEDHLKKNVDTRRYSLPDGKALPSLQTANTSVRIIEVAPDGSTAVVTGDRRDEKDTPKEDKYLTVYDLETGKPRGQLDTGTSYFYSVRYLNADTIVCSHGERLEVWDLKTLRRVWELPVSGTLAVSSDGKQLAVSGGYQIQLYDPATGKRLDTPTAHTGAVTHIRFSPDGKSVTTFGQSEMFAWGLDSKQLRLSTGADRESASGVRATRIDGGVRFRGWDRDTGKEAWTFETKGPLPMRVMSHDGNRVLAVFHDRLNGWSAIVYDGPTGKTVANWDFKTPDSPVPKELVLSGDGRTLLVPSHQTSLYDTETGKIRERMSTSPFEVGYDFGRSSPIVACSHDGARLAAILSVPGTNSNPSTGVVVVFDVKTKREIVRYPWAIGFHGYGLIKFALDGRTVAAWNPGEVGLMVYNAEKKGDPIEFTVSAEVQCVAFSGDSKTLAVGYKDGTALLWDMTEKKK